jgi:hypothetical protein
MVGDENQPVNENGCHVSQKMVTRKPTTRTKAPVHAAGTGRIFPASAARIPSQCACATPRQEARRGDLRPQTPSSRSTHSRVFLHVATVDAAPAQPSARTRYRPRGPDLLRQLFRRRFPEFRAAYERRYAATFGRFRLPSSCAPPRHSASAETGARASPTSRPRYSVAFRCPTRGFNRFRPFSCKSYLLCPSCAQKITLLPREYLSENLLGVGRTPTQKWPKQAQSLRCLTDMTQC